AGVAGGALDQGGPGPDVAPGLGRLDHAQADPVLDRAAGVHALELQEQLTGPGVQVLGLDDGSVADEFEDVLVDRHGGAGRAAEPALGRPRILPARPVAGTRAGPASARAAAARRGWPPPPGGNLSAAAARTCASGGPWRAAFPSSSAPAWRRPREGRPARHPGPACPAPGAGDRAAGTPDCS